MISTQSIVRNPSEGYLEEIIRLQLRKPKSWNWELSTSKSSPHIMLPTIKLYNSKGKLLVEAKDNGMQRRSWHSSDILKPSTLMAVENVKVNNNMGFRDPIPRRLRKCRSDILGSKNNIPYATKYETSVLSKRTSKERDARWRTSENQTENFNHHHHQYRQQHHQQQQQQPITKSRTDVFNESRKPSNSWENVINPRDQKSLNHLRKSRSEVVKSGYYQNIPEENGESVNPIPLRKNRSARDLPRTMQIKPLSYHKRARSDDLFQRMMKYNEESMKRAIADGYRNFITPLVPEKTTEIVNDDVKWENTNENSNSGGGKGRKKNRHNYKLEESEIVLLPDNHVAPDINYFTHKRYRTRTCSAGTLIISEESFNGSPYRRRRRRKTTDDGTPNNDTKAETFPTSPRKDNTPEISRRTIEKGRIRQASDPTAARKTFSPQTEYGKIANKQNGTTTTTTATTTTMPSSNSANTNLFYKDSGVFKCEEVSGNETGNSEANCDYTVQEPMTPGGDAHERKLSGPIIEYLEKSEKLQSRAKNKLQDRGFQTKNAEEIFNNPDNDVAGRIHQAEEEKDATGDDATLLELVRRLSSDGHAKMGANVSRHSSKGLHGRRSQSSGSICNGKGRHASSSDTKMCGSLPSYLDERNAHTCNNNHHDCEKPPLDDVERVPPLGDAAPLHWKFSDTQAVLMCDQGYGSERSPEEEYPPSLPGHDGQCPHHKDPDSFYPFITPESTFIVALVKGSRGLGLSVTGGADSGGSWPGLIRIKRLFPHQPAATCGLLNVGDLLLEVNGITLTGLTNYEALEVLRTTPNQVELTVCRPPPDVLSCVSPISEVPPPPPRRDPPTSLNLTPPPYQPTPEDDLYHGEFDVTLTKINGSLGFTLRKEDDSALGHYVRALVREPALSDGRIRAGDKIIAVNDVEISSMSHEQAVQYLRQAGDVVTLRLYRDAAQTPVSTLSPTETTPRASFSRKANLRPEALDMLNDIAMRKIGNPELCMRSSSPSASPRRFRRQPYSSDSSQITDSSNKYLITEEQFHEGLFKKPSLPLEDEEDPYNSLFSVDSDDCDRPSRPSSLDLCNSKGTPVITRKPKFNFSLAHNAYELNNLDPEILDAPNLTYNLGKDDVKSTEVECSDSFPQEPVSMPHIPSDNPGFSYKNPAYQSAHPPCGIDSTDGPASVDKNSKLIDENNMKKWKGVVFNADEDEKKKEQSQQQARPRKQKVENEYEVLSIELNRGWNSRLGFSLQGAAGVTYVSAVHADSVAAKDGRLKPGDRLLKVNDESVENMSTSEIIDLLRIVRGPVCIVVSRCKSNQDCTNIKSNAEN